MCSIVGEDKVGSKLVVVESVPVNVVVLEVTESVSYFEYQVFEVVG